MKKLINKRVIAISLICLTVCCILPAQTIKSDHDWNSYKYWEDKTVYTKTYIVNQQHPSASDTNPGTGEKPFLTINQAAKVVKAGERVLIFSGVYREMVILKNQGESTDKMISFEAAPGEKAIIKGSRILNTEWVQITRPTDEDFLKFPGLHTRSRKIWLTTVPDSLFTYDYYPLRLQNIEPHHYDLMSWAESMKGIAPCNLSRGLLFQNGMRMTQLAHPGDLPRVPGSFWVAPDGKTVCIHPFGGKNPKNELFEIAVQSHLLKPESVGFGYVRISGLTFEHCANGFLRASTGAVTILGGHHWIFENNTIKQINSSGLEFGYSAFESRDRDPLNVRPRVREEGKNGGVIVRNNTIHDCGTAGIRSHTVIDGIIEKNVIYNCGWQDVETYWEVAGIKLLTTRNTLVRGNHVYDIQGGDGIWLDWNNQYSRVTGNLVHDIQALHSGIFIEASQHPNLVDNNIIWNIDGHGIFGDDSDEQIYAHNLIANTTGPVIHAIVETDRQMNGRPLTAERNNIFNNIFIDGGKEFKLTSNNNLIDYNLYVTNHEPRQLKIENMKAAGFDRNSQEIRAFFEIRENLYFIWKSETEVNRVPVLPFLRTTFFNDTRSGDETIPGPFPELPLDFRIMLSALDSYENTEQ